MEDKKTDKAGMAEVERERKKEDFRRLTTDEEIVIIRIVKEKEEDGDKEEDLIELRMVEEMVLRQFHKYLKVFEKKKLEKMLMRKVWDHTRDLREGFVPKKGKIYLLSRVEREEV